MRRLAVSLSVGVLSAGGCVSLDGLTGGNALNGVPIQTPDPSKISLKSLQAAERVQTLGQRIIEQNTFTGLAPLFHHVAKPEPMIFHRGPDELFISDGVINRCETEEQLAAVLCTELGRMMAEKRTAKVYGVELMSVHEVAAENALGEGKIASAPEPETPPEPKPAAKPDPDRLARDLMRGAGFDPAALEQTKTLLKGAQRGDAFGKQVAGPAPAPRWQP